MPEAAPRTLLEGCSEHVEQPVQADAETNTGVDACLPNIPFERVADLFTWIFILNLVDVAMHHSPHRISRLWELLWSGSLFNF